jgi:hypothetical protein
MTAISGKGSDFIRDLGDAARKNPLSAALIGMGVIWLFMGNRPAERVGDLVRRTRLDRIPDAAGNAFDAARSTLRSGANAFGDSVTSATGTLRENGADVLDNAARRGRDYADTATEYVSSLPETGAEMFETVRSNLSDVFKAQPLALGAIGLAIGAGIAAALPPSEAEAEYLGEASDSMKAKAAEFATEQADRVTTVAGNVMEAVSDEARKQGLTLDDAKAAAADISAKVGRVAEVAGKGISYRRRDTQAAP